MKDWMDWREKNPRYSRALGLKWYQNAAPARCSTQRKEELRNEGLSGYWAEFSCPRVPHCPVLFCLHPSVGATARVVVLACLGDSCGLHRASSADGRTVRLEGMKPLSQSRERGFIVHFRRGKTASAADTGTLPCSNRGQRERVREWAGFARGLACFSHKPEHVECYTIFLRITRQNKGLRGCAGVTMEA